MNFRHNKSSFRRSAFLVVILLLPALFGSCGEGTNWVYVSILGEVQRDLPLQGPQSSNETIQDGDSLEKELNLQAFDPKSDNVEDLIRLGREGDLLSITKLQDYLFENQNTKHRFDILEMSAKFGSLDVPGYYAALIEAGKLDHPRMVVVESAIETLIKESDEGQVSQTLALYRLFGDLNSNGVETRFGNNTELCERFIQRAYSSMKRNDYLNFVRLERLRLGWASRLDSEIVPHTSRGWKPSP